ncbi:MAG: hypothetical protein IPK82_30500 [Polyangiaceae bacterium]|nr:hypothetical protein [Polyangiaceae bacterium]
MGAFGTRPDFMYAEGMPSASIRALCLCLITLVCLPACDGQEATSGSGGSGAGGTSTSGGSTDTGPIPGADATVTPFEKTHVYFKGDDNKRIVDASASFPAEGVYSQILLHLSLECPMGGCDAWDRFASLGIVVEKGATPEEDRVIEIARYITPYKVAASWDIDVTDLRPLLSGEVTMRTFIDTWVGPGSPYGAGWLVTARFEMKGGIPAKVPVAVSPVWERRYVPYGDPAKPVNGTVPPQEIALPSGSSYTLRTFVTGHGQGNLQNCAEFCKRTHTLTAGVTPYAQEIWRADCATTAVPGQQGTWKYSRAGWCPGAFVIPWNVDVTADVAGASTLKVEYGVEDYENTCRPDAPVCEGCSLDTGCEYDGGAHTEPNYQLSTLLITYQ